MLVRPRAMALSVAVVAVTLLVMRLLAGAGRVIGWVAMAAAIATVATPLVNRLSARVPRGLAVVILVLTTFGVAGGVGYGVVDTVVSQLDLLERRLPAAARSIERDGPFAEAARDADLPARVDAFVEELPDRLRGGSAADAARSATTRGLALLAVTVLTIFLVLHGPRLLDGARRQLPRHVRDRAAALTDQVERRAFGYVRAAGARSAIAGCFAAGVTLAADVPGPIAFGLWVAMWDLVPLAGAVIGALPIIVLAAVSSPAKGALVAAAFIAYQVAEDVVVDRRLAARTVRVGPFFTLLFGVAGVELYGLAGGLLGIVAAAITVVVTEEIGAWRTAAAAPTAASEPVAVSSDRRAWCGPS